MRQEGLQKEAQALLPGSCDSASARMLEARGIHCFVYSFVTPSKNNWFYFVACLFVWLFAYFGFDFSCNMALICIVRIHVCLCIYFVHLLNFILITARLLPLQKDDMVTRRMRRCSPPLRCPYSSHPNPNACTNGIAAALGRRLCRMVPVGSMYC